MGEPSGAEILLVIAFLAGIFGLTGLAVFALDLFNPNRQDH